jgi:outer membrane protein
MHNRLLFIPVLAVIFLASGTSARCQDTSTAIFNGDTLSVDEAISTALQNNFDIMLSRNDSAVAALDYSYRDYALFPRVNGNSTVLFNNNNQKQTLADGTKRDRKGIKSNNINYSVGLNWPVFDGFKMFITRDKMQEILILGELNVKEQVNLTISDVIKTYYSIVRHKQQIKAVEEQMSINEDRLKLARYRLEIGVGVKPEVLQAEIDLNAQRSALLTQGTLMIQLRQQLNELMNVDPLTVYEVQDTIVVDMNIALGDVLGNFEASNPTLRALDKTIDIAELTVKERRAERFPTVSLISAYNFNRTSNQEVINNFSPLFNLNRGFNYGVTASIPIFNGFNVRRQIRQAELAVGYQQLIYDNNKRQVSTDVMNAFANYELQKRIMVVEEDNMKLVRENLYIVRERYRLAATPYIELREAQRSLEEAYNRLIAARYNLKIAETDLLRLKGNFTY